MTSFRRLLLPMLAVALACCGRSEPAPDPLKAQRNAIQKTKNVNDVIEKSSTEARTKIEEAETK